MPFSVITICLLAILAAISIYHFRSMRRDGYARSRQRYILLIAASIVFALIVLNLLLSYLV